MYTSTHLKNNRLAVDIPAYLRRHDIVYNRPALKGYEGLPIGNGSMGGLVYHTANQMLMNINHTDAISFAPDGNFKAWAWESEEKNTTPYSCGQLKFVSPLPLFDWVYLEEYEERVNLADGVLTCKAKTPFSNLQYKMYAPAGKACLVLEVTLEQQEEAGLSIQLEKWGSANFFHHYEQVVKTHSKGLMGTQCRAEKNAAVVTHTQTGSASALVAVAVGEEYKIEKQSSHGVTLQFAPQKTHAFTLYIGGAAAKDAANAAANAKQAVNTAQANADLYKNHLQHWHGFWQRSFVHIPDEYIENLYYIHLYQLGCCSMGQHPITFAGLWGWFKDSRNWGHFYHWNHQQTYWGLESANHPQLQSNYLNYRFAMLPNAKQDAKNLFGSEGAFYSDISNLNGYNALEPDTVRNLSVSAQIALHFYQHWQYSGDEAFLREQAIPMLSAAFSLYADMLEEQEGVLYIKGGSTCYESYLNQKTTLTDKVTLQALVNALNSLYAGGFIEEDLWQQSQNMAQKLYSYPVETLQTPEGEKEIFAAGLNWQDEVIGYGEGEYPLSPFPATLVSPVYPAGVVGLSQKGTPLFDIAKNTLQHLLQQDIYKLGKLGCSGHTPTPQAAARLGLQAEMPRIFTHFAKTYQKFPNGLMHFADIEQNQQWSPIDRPRVLTGAEQDTQWEELHDKSKGVRTAISSNWFLHCYFEAAANLFDGVNEMLLQSYDGVIRVFPAFDIAEDAVFCLAAAGGFRVSAETAKGRIRYVALGSNNDSQCRLQNPWPQEAVRILCSGQAVEYTQDKDELVFKTQKGSEYLIYPAAFPPENDYYNDFEYRQNNAAKHMQNVQIGLDPVY